MANEVLKFSWKIWGGKIIKKAVEAGIGVVIGFNLDKVGIHVDKAQASIAAIAAIEALRNIAKTKFPKQLGWL